MSSIPPMTIGADEWDRVAALSRAADADEVAGDAVWLRDTGTGRRWMVQTEAGLYGLGGRGTCGQPVDLALSPRLIHAGALLSHAHAEATLAVPDTDTALVSAAGTSVAIDLLDSPTPELPPPAEDDPPLGQVDAGDLLAFIELSRAIPNGVGSPSGGRPFYWLGTSQDRITAHVDWRRLGAPRASYWLPARTEHGSRTVAVNPIALAAVLIQLADPDEEVSLLFTDGSLGLRGSDWRVWLRTVDGTVTRLAGHLEEALIEAGIAPVQVSPRAFEFGHPVRIRAELHGGEYEIVRLSTVLARAVAPTSEVLAELNDANAGLVGVRLWMQDDLVVAASDLPCQRLDDVGPITARLAEQVGNLGVFLTALASGCEVDER